MGQHKIRAEILEPSATETRWLAVRDLELEVIEFEELPPGTDTLRAYLLALLRYDADGWRFGEIGSVGAACFATRNGRKIRIEVSPLDPKVPFKQPNMHPM
jgi:hypothetical protein